MKGKSYRSRLGRWCVCLIGSDPRPVSGCWGRHGWVVGVLATVCGSLKGLSLGAQVGRFLCRNRGRCGERCYERFIDSYVVLRLLGEVAVLAWLSASPDLRNAAYWRPAMAVLFAYLLAEVVVTGLNVLVFDRLRGHGPLASGERSLVLNVANYVEIVLVFAILNFLFASSDCAWDALQHSIQVAALIGGELEVLGVAGRTLFVAEVALALMFLLFVLARAVALLPPRSGSRG